METADNKKPSTGPINLAVLSTFLALFPTFYVWWISNSTALFADLLRSTTEFLAIFVSWLVLRGMSSKKWTGFNYGFGKIEQLASLVVGGALFVSFLIILAIAAHRIYNPVSPENTIAGLLLSILSVIGNAYVWKKNSEEFERKPSPVIDSQRRLFRAKTYACAILVFALIIPMLIDSSLSMYFDPLGSLIIAFFLLSNAIAITNSSLDDLLDRSIDEAFQMIILKALIKHEDEYKGLKKVRSRRNGTRSQVEIFLELDGKRLLEDIEESVSKIREEIKEDIPEAEIIFVYSSC